MSFSNLGHSAPQIWEATLGQLLLRVTPSNYDAWLRNTMGLRFEATTLVVAAPNELTCDWLSTRMSAVIALSLTTVAGAGLSVRFEPVKNPSQAFPADPLQPGLMPEMPTPLNPRYTFSAFLPFEFNRLALNAALEVADGTTRFSPLLITGPTGSGKTHLLHAIAHEALARGIGFLLSPADQFLTEFTSAVRSGSGAAFRARYREIDLLLIDDAHLLSGKKATLNEFYRTIAGLHDLGRAVAVAGEPIAVKTKRFESQLHWGLVAPIDSSTMEERLRFVETKARSQEIELPDEARQYIALRVKGSVRDLEGAVNRVVALARISSDPISMDFVNQALRAPLNLEEEHPAADPEKFIRAVADQFQLPVTGLLSPKRAREFAYPRQIAMYLMRHDASMTHKSIADALKRKDHTTVMHGCSTIEHQMESSPSVRADLDAVRAIIHSNSTAA